MLRLLVISMLLIAAGCEAASAQQAQTCARRLENREGTDGTVVAVDSTAGGVRVLRADSNRCSALVYNGKAAGNVRCATAGVVPTATVGFTLEAGLGVVFHGKEAYRELRCIQEGGTAGAVSTIETLP